MRILPFTRSDHCRTFQKELIIKPSDVTKRITQYKRVIEQSTEPVYVAELSRKTGIARATVSADFNYNPEVTKQFDYTRLGVVLRGHGPTAATTENGQQYRRLLDSEFTKVGQERNDAWNKVIKAVDAKSLDDILLFIRWTITNYEVTLSQQTTPQTVTKP